MSLQKRDGYSSFQTTVVDFVPHWKKCQQCITCFDTNFYEKYSRFLLLSLYWLEFYKCFSLVSLLSVSLIVYMTLAEPIIRVTRYCLERQLPQCFLSVVDWSSGSQYPTRARTL